MSIIDDSRLVSLDAVKNDIVSLFEAFNTSLAEDPEVEEVKTIFELDVVLELEFDNINILNDVKPGRLVCTLTHEDLNIEPSEKFKSFDRVVTLAFFANDKDKEELRFIFDNFAAYVNMKQPNDTLDSWKVIKRYTPATLEMAGVEEGVEYIAGAISCVYSFLYEAINHEDVIFKINGVELPVIDLTFSKAMDVKAPKFVGQACPEDIIVSKGLNLGVRTILIKSPTEPELNNLNFNIMRDIKSTVSINNSYEVALDFSIGGEDVYQMHISEGTIESATGSFVQIQLTFSLLSELSRT